MQNQHPEYFTTSQAAEYLGRSRFTLGAWRKTDAGPPYCRFGYAVRYRRIDLDAWAERKRQAVAARFSAHADRREPGRPYAQVR